MEMIRCGAVRYALVWCYLLSLSHYGSGNYGMEAATFATVGYFLACPRVLFTRGATSFAVGGGPTGSSHTGTLRQVTHPPSSPVIQPLFATTEKKRKKKEVIEKKFLNFYE